MLISHQNRTEQLQETLRQKMRNEDNWREKVMLEVQLAPFPFLLYFFFFSCSQLSGMSTVSQIPNSWSLNTSIIFVHSVVMGDFSTWVGIERSRYLVGVFPDLADVQVWSRLPRFRGIAKCPCQECSPLSARRWTNSAHPVLRAAVWVIHPIYHSSAWGSTSVPGFVSWYTWQRSVGKQILILK